MSNKPTERNHYDRIGIMEKKNLLIVDDEELLVNSIKFLLKDIAGVIHTSTKSEEALENFNDLDIHCVISDITMPNLNGVEFLKKIRTLGSNIPFIFFT